MEVVAAEAAVSFAVETLGKLLIEKAVFLLGVKEEVEWVRDELKSIQCFLKDAAKKQSDKEGIRNWIFSIRKVAHDAEDAIEIFVLKVQSKSRKKRYGCFPNHLYHLNKVGEQIKSIRQTLVVSSAPTNNLFTDLSLLPNLFHLILREVSLSNDLQGLTSLHRVTRLKIGHDSFRGNPMPIYFPPNLSHLTLSTLWDLEGVSMPVLEKLPNLLYLKIKDIHNTKNETETAINGGFPKLKVLSLQNIKQSGKIEIDEKVMPELNQFIISECPDLDVENVPERIKSAMVVHSH